MTCSDGEPPRWSCGLARGCRGPAHSERGAACGADVERLRGRARLPATAFRPAPARCRPGGRPMPTGGPRNDAPTGRTASSAGDATSDRPRVESPRRGFGERVVALRVGAPVRTPLTAAAGLIAGVVARCSGPLTRRPSTATTPAVAWPRPYSLAPTLRVFAALRAVAARNRSPCLRFASAAVSLRGPTTRRSGPFSVPGSGVRSRESTHCGLSRHLTRGEIVRTHLSRAFGSSHSPRTPRGLSR